MGAAGEGRGCGGSTHRMGGAWWKLSGGYGRCEDVRVGRCVHSGFVLPHGRVCFGQGESPVKLFAKLFGKSAREDGGNATRTAHRAMARARSRAPSARCSGTRSAGPGGDISGGQGASSVDPAGAGRIGFGEPSTSSTGGGFSSDPYATNASAGQPRQEDPSMSARCVRGAVHRNAEASRFCSNCGAPLRAGAPARAPVGDDLDDLHLGPRGVRRRGHRPDAAAVALPRGTGGRRRPAARLGAAGGAPRPELGQPLPAGRRADHGRPSPAERHLPRRRDRLAAPRGVPPGPGRHASRVADVGSLNGTYVNRERIDSVALSNGDEVQIGKYRLVFYASQRGV